MVVGDDDFFTSLVPLGGCPLNQIVPHNGHGNGTPRHQQAHKISRGYIQVWKECTR